MKKYALALTAVAVIALATHDLFAWVLPVQASSAPPNGCQAVGTVGNVIVAMCIDDQTGSAAWANSAGMLAPVP